MKRIEHDWYDARFTDDDVMHLNFRRIPITIEDVKREIDEVNKRKVERGEKTRQYIITHVEHYTYRDDDGRFIKHESYESVIEYYP